MASAKRRLLFIVQNAPPLNSGRARQAIKLADQLRQKQWQVDILSLDDQLVVERTDQCRWRRSFSAVKSNCVFIAGLAFMRGYQAVHFHGFSYAIGLTGMLKILGIRTILNMSAQGFDDPGSLLQQTWLSNVLRRCLHALDAWVVQNPRDKTDQANAVYIPNMVDIPKRVKPFNERKKQILCLGVICPRKGQLQLVKDFAAMPRLARNGWRLLLCGSFDNNYYEFDSDYVNACLQLACKTPGVQILGHLNSYQLTELLADSRMFTALSSREGLSNAYLEALSYGVLPILPVNREDDLFKDLHLSQAAIRWSVSPGLVSAVEHADWKSAAISSSVERNFSASRVLEKLERLYTYGRDNVEQNNTVSYLQQEEN